MKNVVALSELFWILHCMLKFASINSLTDIPVGFPCENIPNFCDRVKCAPPQECDKGVIVDGAGNCGCCQACITYRDVGEDCTGPDTEVPALLPQGVIAQYYEYETCLPGLDCVDNKCQAFSFPDNAVPLNPPPGFKECTYHESECKVNEWEGMPSCDFYGDYAYKSCKGSSNPRCYCVDSAGNTIFGRLPTGSENATCACSRAVTETSKPLSDFFRCDATGDFMPLQCWNSICFCVDPYTKKMTSEAVPIAGIKALACWDSSLYNATYYTPCTTEFLRQSAIVQEQNQKGMKIYPLDLPNCDPDGTYGFKQYQTNAYYCSDRTGAQIASYSSQEYIDYQKMICNCARDGFYSDGLPDSGRGYKCDPYGNYVPTYCIQDLCFCLDSDGQQSSGTFSINDNITCPAVGSTTSYGRVKNKWSDQKLSALTG